MLNFIIPTCSIIAGSCAFSSYVWYKKPKIVIMLYMKYALYKAGYSVKYVTANKYKYAYAEKGIPILAKPSMLFVHGFSASKESWLPILQKIPEDMHVIALDLLGHGDSEFPNDIDNTVDFFISDLHSFIDKLALKKENQKLHLIGQSLGGSLVGRYASLYSDEVDVLTLICPGMLTPEKTNFMKQIEDNTEENLLLPVTIEGLEVMLKETRYNDVKLNKQILIGILQLRNGYMDAHTLLFSNMMKDNSSEENHQSFCQDMKNIKAKTQIIWGEHDRIIHPSGIDTLKEHIPNVVEVHIFEKCGHSINIDRPGLLTKVLLSFVDRYSSGEADLSSKKVE